MEVGRGIDPGPEKGRRDEGDLTVVNANITIEITIGTGAVLGNAITEEKTNITMTDTNIAIRIGKGNGRAGMIWNRGEAPENTKIGKGNAQGIN